MATDYPRIAIVTGATSGIGEATAKEFVAAGYAVVGTGRTASKLEALETELGAAFAGYAGDGAAQETIDALFTLTNEKFGGDPDIVVVNAGRGLGGSVKDADLTEFEDMMRINVTGAIRLMQKAAQKMAESQKTNFPKKAADIVVIGSVVGRQVSPFSAVYGGSKFAVHSMAEGLRREVGPLGVRVTTLAPGIVISGFQEVAGYGEDILNTFEEKFAPMLVGKDIAEAILHVVSLPPHVHISNITVRPTRQDYP
ncbi:SDR family oxidoreductase [Cerasicoccus maritimus]|uniref:SDR family oxidoreductase n=1 Tax=Cerasicoccus maritimus TaxID=490089 RepID=UPI0028527719|nr:SDR family oxidoreductase [Cerasicoccus maritimus]